MLRKRVQARMLVALFIVMTLVAAPLSALAQKAIEYFADKLDFNLFSPRSVGLK